MIRLNWTWCQGQWTEKRKQLWAVKLFLRWDQTFHQKVHYVRKQRGLQKRKSTHSEYKSHHVLMETTADSIWGEVQARWRSECFWFIKGQMMIHYDLIALSQEQWTWARGKNKDEGGWNGSLRNLSYLAEKQIPSGQAFFSLGKLDKWKIKNDKWKFSAGQIVKKFRSFFIHMCMTSNITNVLLLWACLQILLTNIDQKHIKLILAPVVLSNKLSTDNPRKKSFFREKELKII